MPHPETAMGSMQSYPFEPQPYAPGVHVHLRAWCTRKDGKDMITKHE